MGRTKRFLSVLVGSLVVLGAVSCPAYGLELPFGVKPGSKDNGKNLKRNLKDKWTPQVHAGVYVGGVYSDNVNTTPGRNSKGVQLRVIPNISLGLPLGAGTPILGQTLNLGKRKLYVGGGYQYGYIGTDGRKIDFHSNAHQANAMLRYAVSPKASLGSQYNFFRDDYPFAAAGDTFTINDSLTQLKMELTRRLEVTPYYHLQTFNDAGFHDASSVLQDYTSNAVGWDSRYKLSPKVSVIGHSEYANRSFHKNDVKDYDSYGGMGGLDVRLTRKISAHGQGGYVKRYFDVGKDRGSALWDVGVQYIPSRKVVLDLYYKYDLQDTIVPDFIPNKLLPDVTDLIPRNYRAINVQRAGGNLVWILSDKDRFDTGLIYQFARTQSGDDVTIGRKNTKLDENDYQFNVNYSHAFAKWMSMVVGYTNLGRNSNVAENFRANLVSFGVYLGF